MPATFGGLRVVGLWAFGDILGEPRELQRVKVAVVVDISEVPWLSEPVGAEHWANATRMKQNPISGLWRSANAPVWNHHIDRPALIWTAKDGTAEPALTAIRDGQGSEVRLPPPSPEEMRKRLEDELIISLHSLRDHTRTYDDQRWKPGKMTPVSDALWRAADGYLDILDALKP